MRRLCLLGLALAAGCSDALEQTSSSGQVIAVVNSNHTVSFVAAADLSVRTVDLQAGGAPVTPAGRGRTLGGPPRFPASVGLAHNTRLLPARLRLGPGVVFPPPP